MGLLHFVVPIVLLFGWVMATLETSTSYDEVPYESFPFAQSHPNRLATVATLFGMRPTPLDNCSVLELGSASGGNLIPMAAALPASRFVGIDASRRQIEEGQATIRQLGLTNIELETRDIAEVTPTLGQFDYIICHGVWSWVDERLRHKIFEICAEQLTPQGVAFISYNTYPGWHMRATVREMMSYHARKFTTPNERVQHARALLDFLVRSVSDRGDAYSMLLKTEMEALRGKADYYLLHEHLEAVNVPVYFHEFEEMAAGKNLQYLGEADLGAMLAEGFSSDVEGILRHLATNVTEREQYLDFLRNRMFRQTLLCHRGIPLNRQPDHERMKSVYVGASVKPVGEAENPLSKAEVSFAAGHGKVSSADPMVKTALTILGEAWPQVIRFDRLLGLVQARLYPEPVVNAERNVQNAQNLTGNLLQCYVRRFVELHMFPPACVSQASERPVASPLARLQARSGRLVANTAHQIVELNDIALQVVRLADGSRDRAALLESLGELVAGGQIVVSDQGEQTTDPQRVRRVLAESVERTLDQLVRDRLLVQ